MIFSSLSRREKRERKRSSVAALEGRKKNKTSFPCLSLARMRGDKKKRKRGAWRNEGGGEEKKMDGKDLLLHTLITYFLSRNKGGKEKRKPRKGREEK